MRAVVDLRVKYASINYGGLLIATGDHLWRTQDVWGGGTIYDNTGGPGGPLV
jgi:hypothetical protein